MAISKPVRKNVESTYNFIVERAAKAYAAKTGNPMDEKTLLFVKAMVDSMVELVETAVETKGNVNLKHVAKLAVARALAAADVMVDDKSFGACVLATASLAAVSAETFGVMVAASVASATVAGAVVGVPTLVTAGYFYALEVESFAETCGEAYVKYAERQFETSHKFSSQRSVRKVQSVAPGQSTMP